MQKIGVVRQGVIQFVDKRLPKVTTPFRTGVIRTAVKSTGSTKVVPRKIQNKPGAVRLPRLPTSLNAPPSQKKTKTRMFVVLGFGCNHFRKDIKKLYVELKQNSKIDSVEVLCNAKNPRSMTFDIWARLLSKGALLEPTPFVQHITDKVCRALRRNERVVLVGHSYGGSVASRVSMFIRDLCGKDINLSNLRVVTFGSIFIPPPEMTIGVKIKHFAFKNDIAKFCHKVCPKSTYLTLMKPRFRDPVLSHMSYYSKMIDIARTGKFPDGTGF